MEDTDQEDGAVCSESQLLAAAENVLGGYAAAPEDMPTTYFVVVRV